MKKISTLLIFLLLLPFAAAYGVTFYSPSWNPQYGKVFDVVEPSGEIDTADIQNIINEYWNTSCTN